jgi:zinc protease
MEDPDFLADAVFSRALYGSHPYGHQEGGTPESIPAIERQDIVRFHETFYAPNIAAVAIVGDISTAEAFRLAERYFGAWKRKDIPAAQQPAPPKPTGRRIVLIDKPDAVQTEIRVGKLTVARKDPDYFNILIGSYVLGGSGVSRLNQKLRIERGLTYGAYATITPRRGPGNFYSVTDTRTEKTTEALSLILEEMESLRLKEVPAQELKDAQTYVIGSFPLSIELPANLATRLTTIFTYDLGDNYLATYRDRLAAVTSADVLRVAKEKLSPEDVTIVLVGKADDFKDALRPFGEVKVIPAGEVNLGSSF